MCGQTEQQRYFRYLVKNQLMRCVSKSDRFRGKFLNKCESQKNELKQEYSFVIRSKKVKIKKQFILLNLSTIGPTSRRPPSSVSSV